MVRGSQGTWVVFGIRSVQGGEGDEELRLHSLQKRLRFLQARTDSTHLPLQHLRIHVLIIKLNPPKKI